MHFFKEHEPRNDDGKDGKNTHRAEDIIVVADQVSDHEVAAHGVQQEPALVNDGTGVEGENHDAGDSAEESPEKKYQVQATKALPKTPSGEVNTEASMRTPTASTMMRKTKKWRPPMRISWPSGIRKVADRTGQRTYLRGSKKINAMAISMATNTMGCRTVSEAPPPNLRFSGCIRVSPCEAECSSGTHAAGKGRPRDTDIGSTGSESRATRGRHLEVGCSVQSCGLLHLPSVGS